MTTNAFPGIKQSTNLRSQIGDSVAAAIVSGELAPGTIVTVPTLAGQFEVSATPVREAMLDLEQRGLVEPVRNKGFRVTKVSEQDLAEIVELRQLLEAPVMRALAADFPVETIVQWRTLAEQIEMHAQQEDLTGFIEADRAFHLGLLALHGNGRLVELVRELRFQTRMVNLVRMTKSRELSEAASEHFEILDLLESGKADEVEALTIQHLGHIIGWWSSH